MFVQTSIETASKYAGVATPIPSSVALCGRDTTLLWTRKLIMERAGFSVEALVGIEGLERLSFLALILCHTLSDAERNAAIQRYHARLGGTRILVLAGGGRMRSYGDCQVFTDSYRPQMFLNKVGDVAAGTPPTPMH